MNEAIARGSRLFVGRYIVLLVFPIVGLRLFGSEPPGCGLGSTLTNYSSNVTWVISQRYPSLYYRFGKRHCDPKGEIVLVRYETCGVMTSDGVQVAVVNMAYPQMGTTQEAYRHYFTFDPLLLDRVERITQRAGGTNVHFGHSRVGGVLRPFICEHTGSAIPLDFPVLDMCATNLLVQIQGGEVRQEIRFDEDVKGAFTTLIYSRGGVAGKDRRKVEQRWEPGLPWWKWAKVYLNDVLVREAYLVLDKDGKPVRTVAEAEAVMKAADTEEEESPAANKMEMEPVPTE